MDPGFALAIPSEGVGREAVVRCQRTHYRHAVASLAYVRIDHANGGIIRNVSPWGVGIQAVGRLHHDQIVHLRFELLKPKVRIDAGGQVAWADASGQAGIRLLDLPPRTYRLLKDWILTDLLLAASELGPEYAPIFASGDEWQNGLIVSKAQFPSISPGAEAGRETQSSSDADSLLRFSWWPIAIPQRVLARFVDSLVIVSAVLLFSIIFSASARTFPSWPVAVGMELAVGAVFLFVYRYLFTTLGKVTPGWRLAQSASNDTTEVGSKKEDDRPRFR